MEITKDGANELKRLEKERLTRIGNAAGSLRNKLESYKKGLVDFEKKIKDLKNLDKSFYPVIEVMIGNTVPAMFETLIKDSKNMVSKIERTQKFITFIELEENIEILDHVALYYDIIST